MLDDYCRSVIEADRSKLIAWWIMAAWAYELGERPLISDALFDEIAADLDMEWSTVNHQHKHLLDRSALKTSLAIAGKWPLISISAAQSLIKNGDPRIEYDFG